MKLVLWLRLNIKSVLRKVFHVFRKSCKYAWNTFEDTWLVRVSYLLSLTRIVCSSWRQLVLLRIDWLLASRISLTVDLRDIPYCWPPGYPILDSWLLALTRIVCSSWRQLVLLRIDRLLASRISHWRRRNPSYGSCSEPVLLVLIHSHLQIKF